jgi:hypothetical protein
MTGNDMQGFILTPKDPGSLQSGVGGAYLDLYFHSPTMQAYINHKYFVQFSLEYTILIL